MRQYLVVANQTLGGRRLTDEISRLMEAGPCRFHLVVPATHPRHHLTWTEGEARVIAGRNLDEALARLRALGAEVDGEVGDARPVDAVGDALRAVPPCEGIILSTLPAGVSRWLNQDLPHRLERTFGLPVTVVEGAAASVA